MLTSGIGYGFLSFIGIYIVSGVINSVVIVTNGTIEWAFKYSLVLVFSATVISFLLAKKTSAYKYPWITGIVSATIQVPVMWFMLMFSEYVVTRDGRIVLVLFIGLVSTVVVTAVILKKIAKQKLPISEQQSVQKNERKVLPKYFSYLIIATYILSIIFIISGALNLGFSGFWMSIPFMVLAVHLAKKFTDNKKILWFTVAFSAAAIIFNITIEKNPLIFPILHDGYVEVQRDGYYRLFSDGSGGFSPTKEDDVGCIGCGSVTYTKINKGDIYKVTGIRLEHPDFGINISVLTEIGGFDEYDYDETNTLYADDNGEMPVRLNKDVTRFGINTGILMVWPMMLIMLINYIKI